MSKTVRIGGASGFWGDSATATPQLLTSDGLQYLVYDYLAETTLSIMARAREKNPNLGYATDFVQAAMGPHLAEILGKGVRVVANAGGLNPRACHDALIAEAHSQGLTLNVAIVLGDDVLPQFDTLRSQGCTDMYSGEAPPAGLYSANAYLGAQGIAKALAMGADIVITGRCVDSALVLGILAHEFAWAWNDWDAMAAGTLAGHIIECGAQATGGLFTDWQEVPDWAHIGYPIIDCSADGSFVLSKPPNTGGLIHPGAVAEQVLYEVGDPANYLMPDVTCDFRQVSVVAQAPGCVHVSGARGRPPTDTYKANGTWRDGYQLQVMLAIRGIDAPAKARKTAEALLERTSGLLRQHGYPDYSETRTELLGCDSHYGPYAHTVAVREVVLRIAVRHSEAKGLAFLQRECASAGTSMAAGTRSSFSGRASIQPVIKVFSFLVPKSSIRPEVRLGNLSKTVGVALGHRQAEPPQESGAYPEPVSASRDDMLTVPLVRLAWARSGDKGDIVNIGVIARKPEYLPSLREQLTPEAVAAWFAHLINGRVERFNVPGLNAFNFLLNHALDGGGVASLRSDPLGKSFAQILLDYPIVISAQALEQ